MAMAGKCQAGYTSSSKFLSKQEISEELITEDHLLQEKEVSPVRYYLPNIPAFGTFGVVQIL